MADRPVNGRPEGGRGFVVVVVVVVRRRSLGTTSLRRVCWRDFLVEGNVVRSRPRRNVLSGVRGLQTQFGGPLPISPSLMQIDPPIKVVSFMLASAT